MIFEEREEVPPGVVAELLGLVGGDADEVVEMLRAFGLDGEGDLLEEEGEPLDGSE